MKKILFIAHRPPPIHGASLTSEKVFQILSRKFNVEYVRLSQSKDIEDLGKNKFKKILLTPLLLSKIAWRICTLKPDFIYLTPSLNSYVSIRDYLILSISLFYKIFNKNLELICHVHMSMSFVSNNLFFRALFRPIFKNINIVSLAPNLLEEYKFKFKKEFVIPNYVEPIEIMKPEIIKKISQKYNISNLVKDKKNILYIGHISESKGVFRLLKIAEQLKSINFLFGGEFMSKREKKYFLDKISTKKNCFYFGKVTGEEKKLLFNISNCLIIPSYSEALPLVLIESFSNGLPVVSTPVGAVPHFLNHKLGASTDFSNFKDSINEVLHNERDYYSENCVMEYKKNFSYETFKKKIIGLFKN